MRASPGGRHPRWGTHNALLSLGDAVYLELIAPDPRREAGVEPRVFGVREAGQPRLVAWAARVHSLEDVVGRAASAGVRLGEVIAGSRARPDGTVLSWRLTDPDHVLEDGVVPFLIEWGATAHPSEDAAPAGRLISLRAEHPYPDRVARTLGALAFDMEVEAAEEPALVATLDTPRGRVVLR